MKSRIFQTDAPRTVALTVCHARWLVAGPRGLEFATKIVLHTPRRTLTDMLVETDDGTSEEDIRYAIQAAALADDWSLADEIARRYQLVVCLRCATDVAERPTWRLHHLLRHIRDVDDEPVSSADWGEICGPCAVDMLDLRPGEDLAR